MPEKPKVQCKQTMPIVGGTAYCLEDEGHEGCHVFHLQMEDIIHAPTPAPPQAMVPLASALNIVVRHWEECTGAGCPCYEKMAEKLELAAAAPTPAPEPTATQTEGDAWPVECPSCHATEKQDRRTLYKGWGDPTYLRNYFTCYHPWHFDKWQTEREKLVERSLSATGETPRCTHDPNTCKVGFCNWPKCNEDTDEGPSERTLDEERAERTEEEIRREFESWREQWKRDHKKYPTLWDGYKSGLAARGKETQ